VKEIGEIISTGSLFEDIYQKTEYINVKELKKNNQLFKMAIGEASLPIAFKLFD
jgi:hypothetical protein